MPDKAPLVCKNNSHTNPLSVCEQEGLALNSALFEHLFSLYHLHDTIHPMLAFLGAYLGLDRVLVLEKNTDTESLQLVDAWVSNEHDAAPAQKHPITIQKLDFSQATKINTVFFGNNLRLFFENREAQPAESSFVASELIHNHVSIGTIIFEKFTATQPWHPQEAEAFSLIGKFIGTALRQKHIIRILQAKQQNTYNLLNGVHFYVYVIEKETHRLLYFNDAVARTFPKAALGLPCHQVFWGKTSICSFCPSRNLGVSNCVTDVLPHSPSWKISDVSLSPILWDNLTPAYVVLITEHIPSENERKEQLRHEAFTAAMAAVYDYVFDINLDTGCYDLLAISNNVSLLKKKHGVYQDDLQHIDTYIHKDFVAQFKTIFSLENMRLGIAREMEFLSLQDTEYRWKLHQSFPYQQKNGSKHMLSVVHDIHETKLAALKKHQEESNIQVALRNSYSRIYLLNLENQHFSCLFNNNALLKPVTLTGQFDKDIEILDKEVVHPSDRAIFCAFYTLNTIKEGLAAGRELTIEYRCQDTLGEYKWSSASIEPLPYTSAKAMLLVRDVTERRKLEAAQRDLEMRYAMVFRQSCDSCLEISLNTGVYKRTTFSKNEFDHIPPHGNYVNLLNSVIKSIIHNDDKELFLETFDFSHLHHAYQEKRKGIVIQYRLYNNIEKCYFWKEGRIFFLDEQKGPLVFILVHDITHQKNLELQKKDDEQRFNLAIRNTYCEIYEIDTTNRQWTHCFSTGQLLLMPNGPLKKIAQKYIHPEDRKLFLSIYSHQGITQRLQRDFAGDTTEEYRRVDTNGIYHWVNATIVPMPSRAGTITKGLLLVRDITEKKEQEQRQRMAEQYDRALRNIYDFMYELNLSNNTYKIIYYVKNKYVIPRETGSLSSLLPFMANNTIHPEDRERFLESFNLERINNYFSGNGECIIGEFRKLCVNGSYRWSSLTMFPVSTADTDQKIFLVFAMDISDKKEAEEIAQQNAILALQRLDDERYRTIIEQTDTLVFEWWEGSNKQYVAPALAQRFVGNYNDRELFQIWREDKTIQEKDADKLNALIATLQAGEKYAEMTIRLRKRTGKEIWCRVAVSCTSEAGQLPKRYIGTVNDVDAATQSLNELRFRSEYDVLTKIYNMSAFYTHAFAALQKNSTAQYYIVRMDIERFKIINDLYGLSEGDKLLQYIAELLKKIPNSICGRISGDIFCMMLEGTQKTIVQCITTLIEQLTQYPLPYKIKATFGICPVANTETPINVMCDWANLALKTVKGSYLYSYAFYEGKLREKILDEKRIENKMHFALHEGQFALYLQPKVHIPSSRIIGAEGLVRWQHPTEGLITPNRFIPLFEKNGFILQLDEYIWEQTCIVLRRWLDQGLTPPPISVNMSRTHIHDPLLQEKLQNLMQKYNLPLGLLQLEVTESVFLDNESDLYATMNTLRKQGFLFSMDDFGSGYSSLNMLKNIPVDFIKIDREFLNEVTTTERGKTVIRYSIAMAHEMQIGVIAEGVETAQQAAFLLQTGCAYAQGFLYARPLPVEAFEALAFGDVQPPFPIDPCIQELTKKHR